MQLETSNAEVPHKDMNLLLLSGTVVKRTFLRALLVTFAAVLAVMSAPARAQEETKPQPDSAANPVAVKQMLLRLEQTFVAVDRLIIEIKTGSSAFMVRQKAKKSLKNELAAMENDVHSTYYVLNKVDKKSVDNWLQLNLLPKIEVLQHLIDPPTVDDDDDMEPEGEGEENSQGTQAAPGAGVKPAAPEHQQASQQTEKGVDNQPATVGEKSVRANGATDLPTQFWFASSQGPRATRAVSPQFQDWTERKLLPAVANCRKHSPFSAKIDIAVGDPRADSRFGPARSYGTGGAPTRLSQFPWLPRYVRLPKRGPEYIFFQCVAKNTGLPLIIDGGSGRQRSSNVQMDDTVLDDGSGRTRVDNTIMQDTIDIIVITGHMPRVDELEGDDYGDHYPPSVAIDLPSQCTQVAVDGFCGTIFVGMPFKAFQTAIKGLGPKWQSNKSGFDPSNVMDHDPENCAEVKIDGKILLRGGCDNHARIRWISLYSNQFTTAEGLRPGADALKACGVLGSGFMVDSLVETTIRLTNHAVAGILDKDGRRLRGIYLDTIAPQYTRAIEAETESDASREEAEAAKRKIFWAKQDRLNAEANFAAFPANLKRCQATIASILASFSAERKAGERGAVRDVEAAVKRQDNGQSKLLFLQMHVKQAIEFAKTEKNAALAAEAMDAKAADCLASRGPAPKIAPHFYRLPRGRYRR